MRSMTEDSRSEAEWTGMRGRHVHGDDRIRALWRNARGFGDDHQDMNFDAVSLSAITARTLVVHGDRDPLYPVELAVELFRAIPAAALWVVPNGAHGPIFNDQAPPFIATAAAFLSAV
jgi:pimeloyl-ACP methyl ester carboxylesterase